jgi:hypothetical protein
MLLGVIRIDASDAGPVLLVRRPVVFPPVATLASWLVVFLAAAAATGLLFTELILLVEACLLRVLAVFAAPWPLPMEAASLGVGSKLTGPLLTLEPDHKLDPAIPGVGSKIDRYAGIR